jgi:integrase
LEHWLDYIKRDTKLKELKRTDCENYFHARTKTKKQISISQTTVENEQSTINAMMSWLFRYNETYIDGFDFKKLPRIDKGNVENRRDTFTDDEIAEIRKQLETYIADALVDIEGSGNLVKVIAGYYLLISIITGLRRGEQLQLCWSDVKWIEHLVGGEEGNGISLIQITVRAETSKVRKTRIFAVQDLEYFDNLYKLLSKRYFEKNKDKNEKNNFAKTLIFSANGKTAITARSIGYHFDKIMELAEIDGLDKRDIVPYSFRHYFITQRVNSGLTPTQVAEICGTSVTQIDKTYYHTTHDKMISNALADYTIKDGMIILRKQ